MWNSKMQPSRCTASPSSTSRGKIVEKRRNNILNKKMKCPILYSFVVKESLGWAPEQVSLFVSLLIYGPDSHC